MGLLHAAGGGRRLARRCRAKSRGGSGTSASPEDGRAASGAAGNAKRRPPQRDKVTPRRARWRAATAHPQRPRRAPALPPLPPLIHPRLWLATGGRRVAARRVPSASGAAERPAPPSQRPQREPTPRRTQPCAPLVASCLRGALPPVDLRAVCLVRAILLCFVQRRVRMRGRGGRTLILQRTRHVAHTPCSAQRRGCPKTRQRAI